MLLSEIEQKKMLVVKLLFFATTTLPCEKNVNNWLIDQNEFRPKKPRHSFPHQKDQKHENFALS